MSDTAILRLAGPDRKGIVATVADFLYRRDANILHADQHQDASHGLFLTRIEWDLAGCAVNYERFRAEFAPVATALGMEWSLARGSDRDRVCVFVSQQDHCLVDLLHRHGDGALGCDIVAVISNHPDVEPIVRFHKLPFYHLPVTAVSRGAVETQQRRILEEHSVTLAVLARYMQVLSENFLTQFGRPVINVHHSFLPAFSGAKPYHRAFERGVKLIGATSHYVTKDLDDGPIIEQDVVRVSHRDQVSDLAHKGRDLERMVLARAVRWHAERRILVYAARTVIFD